MEWSGVEGEEMKERDKRRRKGEEEAVKEKWSAKNKGREKRKIKGRRNELSSPLILTGIVPQTDTMFSVAPVG